MVALPHCPPLDRPIIRLVFPHSTLAGQVAQLRQHLADAAAGSDDNEESDDDVAAALHRTPRRCESCAGRGPHSEG